jgi:uncharacterized protein (DUF362 family)
LDLTRREMIGFAAAAAARAAAPRPPEWFGLHPFIEANPKAVFIHRTRVPVKTDSAAKRAAGLQLAREIFVPMDRPGIPISRRVMLKPNAISIRSRTRPDIENMGTGTDPDFYEGIVLGLKELGLKRFHFADSTTYDTWNYRGFVDVNDRQGIEMNEPDPRIRDLRRTGEVVWAKVPDGVVFRNIPHYAPAGAPDTWLLNIAKWKAHGMCLTQSVKNEQGLVAQPFVRFCSGWAGVTGVPEVMKPDIRPDAEARIRRYFENHRRLGYARYESAARLGPIAQEIWAHKTCDNVSTLETGLAMIEGIYARDGDGFHVGDDRMANLVMFGKHKFRLDVVGLWLGGHEPGNVHLYRIAKERGLTDTFNPWEVPVFEWEGGRAVPRKLSDFPRTPLKTYYLRKAGEPEYHLVNERFDYDKA